MNIQVLVPQGSNEMGQVQVQGREDGRPGGCGISVPVHIAETDTVAQAQAKVHAEAKAYLQHVINEL